VDSAAQFLGEHLSARPDQYDFGQIPAVGGGSTITFPGSQAASYGSYPLGSPGAWWGSLAAGSQDGSGYQYRRNRYYDPTTGRFTQEDPLGLAGGINAYGFANGDPVSYSDPFGLCPWCIGAGIGAIVGGGGTIAYNLWKGKPWDEHVIRNTLIGAAAGATLGFGWQAVVARAATGAVAAEATAAGTAAASKIPFEGFQEWGRAAVGWGQDAAGATKALAEMTAEKAATLDPAKVQAAKAFYENAVANGKGGAAAPVRVELMQKVLDLQK
jgi:RHS repeat-associated protein